MAKQTTTQKEPVKLREKKLSNGNVSLFLDIYRNGKRHKEYLKLYLIHEKLYNGCKYRLQHILYFSRLLRKRLMVLWSGVTLPVSHMKRMSLRQNSSMRRLE